MAQLACVQCSVSSDYFLLILAAGVLAEVFAEAVGAHWWMHWSKWVGSENAFEVQHLRKRQLLAKLRRS